jgi:hypothetical protein
VKTAAVGYGVCGLCDETKLLSRANAGPASSIRIAPVASRRLSGPGDSLSAVQRRGTSGAAGFSQLHSPGLRIEVTDRYQEPPLHFQQVRRLVPYAVARSICGHPLHEFVIRQMSKRRRHHAPFSSGRQATVMIWLTVVIAALTVAIAVLTGLMVWKG